jgi:hypothetical protein
LQLGTVDVVHVCSGTNVVMPLITNVQQTMNRQEPSATVAPVAGAHDS